jgi:hypothetical protein
MIPGARGQVITENHRSIPEWSWDDNICSEVRRVPDLSNKRFLVYSGSLANNGNRRSDPPRECWHLHQLPGQ